MTIDNRDSMDWKRLYVMYCVMSRRLTRARSVFQVPGVATQGKNNADCVVMPLCRGKRRCVSGSTHLLCATALLLDGAFTFN